MFYKPPVDIKARSGHTLQEYGPNKPVALNLQCLPVIDYLFKVEGGNLFQQTYRFFPGRSIKYEPELVWEY
jgi:hypothetical protein